MIQRRECKLWILALTHICISILVALSLFLKLELPYSSFEGGGLLEVLTNIKSSGINDQCVVITILSVAFYTFLKTEYKTTRSVAIVSTVISLIWVCAKVFSSGNSLDIIVASPGQVVKTVIVFAGNYVVLSIFGRTIQRLSDTPSMSCPDSIRFKRITIYVFSIFLIACIANSIFTFPVEVDGDSIVEIGQYKGWYRLTTHHPITHVMFLGIVNNLGYQVGNVNLIMYMVPLVQSIIFSCVFTYSIITLIKFRTNPWVTVLAFAAALFSPYYIHYTGVTLKDTFYSYFFLWFFIEYFHLFVKNEQMNRWQIARFCISNFLVFISRNNGPFVVVLSFCVFLFVWGINKNLRIELGRKVITFTTISIVLGFAWNTAIVGITGAGQHSMADSLSLPLQQTARVIKTHKEDLTEEEKAIIEKVMDIDLAAEKYNPLISDKIKYLMIDKNPTKSDRNRYLILWFKMFFKYPGEYICATINQNYPLLYPFIENREIYTNTINPEEPVHGITVIPEQTKEKTIYGKWLELLYSLPFIGVLTTPAFYTIICLFVFAFSIQHKNLKNILISTPIMVSILIVVAGPAIQWMPRISLPIIYTTPLFLSFFSMTKRKDITAAGL